MKRKTKQQLILLALVAGGLVSFHYQVATNIFVPLSIAAMVFVLAQFLLSFLWYHIIIPVFYRPMNRLFRVILKMMFV